MRVDFHATGALGAMLVAALCLSAAGCSLLNDFAPRSSRSVAATDTTGSVQVKPAVLVQDGAGSSITTAGQTRTSLDGVPPLPKDDSAPAQPASKLLSPEEKAKVIAELEALASVPAGKPAASKADCAATSATTGQTGSTSGAAPACPSPPKPAVHP
jgi:hypothetical protein